MSIEQEKMIVEALPSLYPLKNFEEEAIHAVIDALPPSQPEPLQPWEVLAAQAVLSLPEPHWIPVTERLPKDNRQVLVYARSVHYALAKYDEMRNADGTYKKQWVTFDAWKPLYTIKEVIAWMPLPEKR